MVMYEQEVENKDFICPYCKEGSFTTDKKPIVKDNNPSVVYHKYTCSNKSCLYTIDYPIYY